ncbi:MAG: hypothetical protein HY613_03760 [Candidatus Rokubacteria bacterium]|nr:hypothetical protein [Candidatus Rokubacteria bacterium]
MTAKDIILSIVTAYADLYVRQQALVHVAAKLIEFPVETVEAELQAWREVHFASAGREGADRIREILQGSGLVPRLPDLPPDLPLTF